MKRYTFLGRFTLRTEGKTCAIGIIKKLPPKKQGNVCVEKMKCDDDEGGTIGFHCINEVNGGRYG